MIQLKTTVSVPTEVSIELETPAFFKNPIGSFKEFIGVFDECTISIILIDDSYTSLRNEATEKMLKEIKHALDSWEHIAEEEFMEALDKALKDFNFKIGYKETALQSDAEMERRSQQW